AHGLLFINCSWYLYDFSNNFY
ncbi:hypothetical protein A5882_003485, partial [Enterococcus sp. 4E1_DIV0656]